MVVHFDRAHIHTHTHTYIISKFFKLSFKRSGGGRTSYIRIQRIIKFWTLKVN